MPATWCFGLHKFQSTPPAWGATIHGCIPSQALLVSIHAPRVGGDPPRAGKKLIALWFQSTPPAWGATKVYVTLPKPTMFQSTPPAWGATKARLQKLWDEGVSIHAPRVGGDAVC